MIHALFFKFIFVILLCICIPVEVLPATLKSDSSTSYELNSTSLRTPILIAAISSIAFLTVLVVVILKCMDCYNQEVSSENHPACADKTYKWGGAEGYMSANPSNPNSGFRTGETVEMTPQQSLPYALIPTNVPTAGGFQGFSVPGQDDGQSSTGFGYQASVRSNSSYGGGTRHYNPADQEEPPPAYEAAARSGSFYGNR